MNHYPSDHPRVIAVSPALSPSTRAAVWPRGVDSGLLAVMERKAGITPPALASKPAAKPAVTTVAAKPTSPPAAQPQARTPATRAAPPAPLTPSRQARLDRAMADAISEFNRKNKL